MLPLKGLSRGSPGITGCSRSGLYSICRGLGASVAYVYPQGDPEPLFLQGTQNARVL